MAANSSRARPRLLGNGLQSFLESRVHPARRIDAILRNVDEVLDEIPFRLAGDAEASQLWILRGCFLQCAQGVGFDFTKKFRQSVGLVVCARPISDLRVRSKELFT